MDRDRYRPAVAAWHRGEGDVHVPPILDLEVPVYFIPNGSSGLTKLRAFRRLVRQLRPEVVHSYSFHTNIAASWAAQGTNAVPVGSIRSDFHWAKKDAGPLLGRLCARWPSHQISNSFAAAASVRNSRSFFVPGQCDVVSNGLDLEKFRHRAPPTGRTVRIVGVGYLLPIKRWDRLLRAARRLKQQGLDFTIGIVGDGPLRQALEQQARDLEVTDRVQFLPHADDVPAVLADSSFLVLTSESEGCPNAVMEAMACGRAVVAANVGDIPKLIENDRSGFLVPSEDEAALAERMATLIRDRELCVRMGEVGRQKAERDFSLDRLVAETLAAYQRAGWQAEEEDAACTRELVED
jgi:glycosyltransferase involved in cell wall biosynthesis